MERTPEGVPEALVFCADAPTILLSHNPDSKETLSSYPWDLILSRHTHGGQCDLVFFGTPFAPVRDKRYVRGLNRWKDRWIHTTKGVGTSTECA